MNTPPSLRPATKRDAPDLVRLINQAYAGVPGKSWTSESGLVRGPRITEADVLQRIEGPPGAILVLARGGDLLVGCVHVEDRGAQGYIGLLSVDPDAQSAKVGTSLMKGAEHHIRHAFDRRRAAVWVISARPELRAWYERLGYAATGETAPFPEDEALAPGMSFVVLEKTLA